MVELKYARKATENLNRMFKKLYELNQDKNKQLILLIDEVLVNFDDFDFTLLLVRCPK